jgi:hypothetical protein
MTLLPAWRISHRPWHRTMNLSFEDWDNTTTPSVWAVMGYTTAAMRPFSYTAGFTGQAFARVELDSTDANFQYLGYIFKPNSNPIMFSPGSHCIRASARMFPLGAQSSGSWLEGRVGIFASNSTTGDKVDAAMYTGNFHTLYSQRHQNSWQFINTGSATWSNSASVQVFILSVESVAGAAIFVDDVRVYFDEFEVPQHSKQEVWNEGAESRKRSLTGRVFNTQTATKRRWKIPFDHLEQIGWERLDRWFANDLKLWITDPSCNSYPAKFTGRANPVGKAVEANLSLRSGVIELESDYHLPIVGNVAGEPLP